MNRGRMGRIGGVLACAVILAATAVSASAQGPEGAPGMGPHRPPMERAMGPHGDHGRWWDDAQTVEKYKLSDTQRKAMDDIYQQHRMTLVDLHATLEKAELAMEPLMREDQPDEGKSLSQIDRVAQARAELEKANARMLLGIRKELTPEQWKQIRADREARRSQGGPGSGPGSGGPGARWGHRPGDGPGGPGAGGPGGSGPGSAGPGAQGAPGGPGEME
jgi:periplasmic protein CpxP/Spy